MSARAKTIRRHATRAPQPGPWRLDRQGDSWVVLDANGFWVCDVGRDELDARHIAACDPQSVIKLLDDLDAMTKARDEACDNLEARTDRAQRLHAASVLRKVGA